MAAHTTPTDNVPRAWLVLLLRGMVSFLFALPPLVRPDFDLTSLLVMFAAFTVVDGIPCNSSAPLILRNSWCVLWLRVLMGVGIGLMTLFIPSASALALLLCTLILSNDVAHLATSSALWKEVGADWLPSLLGLGVFATIMILLLRPDVGVLVVACLIASYAMAHGAILIALSLELRTFARGVGDAGGTLSEHAEAGTVPALQRASNPSGWRSAFWQRRWSPLVKLVASTAGAAPAGDGVTRHDVRGAVLAGQGSDSSHEPRGIAKPA